MERSARLPGFSLVIELFRDCHRVGIRLQQGAQLVVRETQHHLQRNGARQAQAVFARQESLRDLVNFAGQGIRVAVEQQPLSRTNPENGRSAFSAATCSGG